MTIILRRCQLNNSFSFYLINAQLTSIYNKGKEETKAEPNPNPKSAVLNPGGAVPNLKGAVLNSRRAVPNPLSVFLHRDEFLMFIQQMISQ